MSRSLVPLFAICVTACGSAAGGLFTVGGTITGLTADGLVLQLDETEDLRVDAGSTSFSFDGRLPRGRTYVVGVKAQPSGLVCAVANGAGSIGSSSVSDVVVSCAEGHMVGGTIRGLADGESVTLKLDGAAMTVSANGPFTFPNAVACAATYVVTVATAPRYDACTVSNAAGTMGHADVTDVAVTCSADLPERPALGVSAAAKMLRFTWTAAARAGWYRFYEDPDGTGFLQRGGELAEPRFDMGVTVFAHDWTHARYRVEACNPLGCTSSDAIAADLMVDAIGVLRAPGGGDVSLSLSAAGDELAVVEDESGLGGPSVFSRSGAGWAQEAIGVDVVPTPNGLQTVVALSADGNTMAVGDRFGANAAGAVYVLVRSGASWVQQAYLQPTGAETEFGSSVALSADGETLAVGAAERGSSAQGTVYVFVRSGDAWSLQAQMNPPGTHDRFGEAVALSASGDVLVAAAISSNVYRYSRAGSGWTLDRAISPRTSGPEGWSYGNALALSGDGHGGYILAVGEEDWGFPDPRTGNPRADACGSVYIFGWSDDEDVHLLARLYPYHHAALEVFGASLALSGDGAVLAVGAPGEDGGGIGIGGDPDDNSELDSGAVYLFTKDGWARTAYVKAPRRGRGFGYSISLSADGKTLAVRGSGVAYLY